MYNYVMSERLVQKSKSRLFDVSALILGTTLFMLFCFPVAHACSCIEVQSSGPCKGLGNEGYLFVGTVVSNTPESSSVGNLYELTANRKIVFEVNERFVGAMGPKIEISTGSGGGDCGYPFENAKTYLVSASDWQGKPYTSICSITTPIGRAYHLVEQFRRMRDGKQVASVYGLLMQYVQDPFTYHFLFDQPLSNFEVRLNSDKFEFSTNTDSHGGFSFYELPAGTYVASIDPPKGYILQATGGKNIIKIGSDACYQQNLEVVSTGSIRGTVLDENQSPIKGVYVCLFKPGVENKDPDRRQLLRAPFQLTDSQGRFLFSELPDGNYGLEVHSSLPGGKTRVPYQPQTIQPNELEIQIHVQDGNILDVGNIFLKKWQDQYSAQFLVLWNDGTPALNARVYSTSLPKSNDSARDGEDVDANGRASMQLLSEYQYEISAEVECIDESTRNSNVLRVQTPSEYKIILQGHKCKPKHN